MKVKLKQLNYAMSEEMYKYRTHSLLALFHIKPEKFQKRIKRRFSMRLLVQSYYVSKIYTIHV